MLLGRSRALLGYFSYQAIPVESGCVAFGRLQAADVYRGRLQCFHDLAWGHIPKGEPEAPPRPPPAPVGRSPKGPHSGVKEEPTC